MRKTMFVAAILAATTLGSAAQAASFDVVYTAAGQGPSGTFPASTFSGTLSLSDTANSAGFFTVIGLTGTRDGNAATLISANGFPLNAQPNNNLFRPSSSYLTELGLSYTAGGRFYNLYSDGSLFECSSSSSADCSFGASNRVTNFTVSPAAAGAVPEPATWAMMLVGFGGIGFAMRRRKSKVTTKVAHA